MEHPVTIKITDYNLVYWKLSKYSQFNRVCFY